MSNEHAIVLTDLPQPTTAGEPLVHAREGALSLRYGTSDEKIAIVRFPLCHYLIFGSPNDEALHGHPLFSKGLKFYSVHEIVGSSLIQMLERRNSVHARHNKDSFRRDLKHYVFTFEDSTLECVVREAQQSKPIITIFQTDKKAHEAWQKLLIS
ncbi:MAG TPA: hypothetical protein VGP94_06060 [Tepidisphaeraceae bacterium]|nr:hypothetical protein [Tepidisphaeraceae bacterium]